MNLLRCLLTGLSGSIGNNATRLGAAYEKLTVKG